MKLQATANISGLAPIAATVKRLENPAPLYKAWANYLEEVAVRAFKEQKAPYGLPWEDLSPAYERRKLAAGQTRKGKKGKAKSRPVGQGMLKLRWTGQLYDSIYAEAERDGAVVGSNLAVGSFSLAAIHQFGAPRRNIPARQFIPIDEVGEVTRPAAVELRRLGEDFLSIRGL